MIQSKGSTHCQKFFPYDCKIILYNGKQLHAVKSGTALDHPEIYISTKWLFFLAFYIVYLNFDMHYLNKQQHKSHSSIVSSPLR
ncbi:hypothetical protein T10_7545 [Trichinella papuae]|uniref:Uncharacterized protein n=1 Tax=Trichinella papuae TaxID=268474 RepID=A0A0V1MVP1_9BILA|nr:hypothetical protein T10_7545 [Trichinella papuae]